MSILEMSLSGGAVILAAILIRAVGKNRLPVGAFEALWALAVLRLTAPVRLPFRFSAFALVRRLVPHTAGPGPLPAAIAQPGQAAVQAVDIIQAAPLPDRGMPFPTGTVLWLVVACALALLFAVSYARSYRRFHGAEPVDSNYVNQFLAVHPLHRTVQARVSDRISAPLTYGLFRPVILLPRSIDMTDEAALGFVLTHELAHIRRFDALRKPALAAVACLHWFNPLVWTMLVLAGRDMERACDRAVIDAFGPEARHSYARALLDMEERRGILAAASGFSRNAIEERIHSIMKIRKKTFLSGTLALALVLTVGAVFATAAPEPEGGTPPTLFSGDVITTSDGTVYLFTEDGEPLAMTQQEYKILTDPVEVEWWTAEEYAQWLEQEKKDLQECLGERAWTSSDGWFTWTQEKIDETIEMYEHTLEEIEDGLLVSKAVDGSGDVMLVQGDGWDVRFMTGEGAAAVYEGNEKTAAEREALEERLARLDAEREALAQRLAQIGEAKEEPPREDAQPVQEDDGTVTVPADEDTAEFFGQADGAPYGQLDGGGRVKVAELTAARGSTVSVGLQTRADATLTVSLHGDANHLGKSVELKAGEMQTVTLSPSQDDKYSLYLTNNSGYPVEFIVSWAVS